MREPKDEDEEVYLSQFGPLLAKGEEAEFFILVFLHI